MPEPILTFNSEYFQNFLLPLSDQYQLNVPEVFHHIMRKYPLWLFLLFYTCISSSVESQDLQDVNFSPKGSIIPGKGEYTYLSSGTPWRIPQPARADTGHLNEAIFKKERPLNFYAVTVPAVGIGYGIIALHQSAPKALNFSTRNELEEDHPHFLTHADNYLQFSPAAAVIGLNIAGIHGKNNFKDELCIYGISSLIMLSSVHIIKPIAHEERPDHSGFSSFPSGHTATAFAAAEWLRAEYWHRSPWIGVAGYAVATATGVLRVYNNRHWVSDVVAGAAIGFLSTRIAYAVNPWVEKHILHADRKENKLSFNTRLEWHYPAYSKYGTK